MRNLGSLFMNLLGSPQVEPLSFGAICVVCNVCGCCGFIQRATDNREVPNIVVADYTQLQIPPKSLDDVLHIGLAERNAIEMENSRGHRCETLRTFAA